MVVALLMALMVLHCRLVVMVMFLNHLERQRFMMGRAARCLDGSSHALNGQCCHQQPKQKCLEDAIHFISLA